MPRIKILFPTELEARPFVSQGVADGVEVTISGVGQTSTAYATMKAAADKPDLIILAGIAGAFDHSVAMAEVVTVSEENEGDLGVWRNGRFSRLPIADRRFRLNCPYTKNYGLDKLRSVGSVTVSTAGSERIDRGSAAIENMEGSAFFHVCILEKIPFVEIRAISNIVSDSPDKWCIKPALDNLSKTLRQITL